MDLHHLSFFRNRITTYSISILFTHLKHSTPVQSGFYNGATYALHIVNVLENGLYKKLLYLLPVSLGRQVLARFPCSNPTLTPTASN